MPENYEYKPQDVKATQTSPDTQYAHNQAQPVQGTAVQSEVKPFETVQGQMTGLLDSNSDYMKRAEAKGTSFANSRGLLNTSMGAGAAQAASIDAAFPIASQDADIYSRQRSQNQSEQNSMNQLNTQLGTQVNLANSDAANRFGMANVEQQQQLQQMAVAQGYDLQTLQKKHGFDTDLATAMHGFDLQKLSLANNYTLEQMQQKYGHEMDLTQAELASKMDQLNLAHDLGMISDAQKFQWEDALQGARIANDQWAKQLQNELDWAGLDEKQVQYLGGSIAGIQHTMMNSYLAIMTDPTLNELPAGERQNLANASIAQYKASIEMLNSLSKLKATTTYSV